MADVRWEVWLILFGLILGLGVHQFHDHLIYSDPVLQPWECLSCEPREVI